MTVSERNTHLHFYSEGIFAEIATKWLKRCEKSQRGFVFCRITNSTNLITSRVLDLFATVNSVLPKLTVKINASRYFANSEALLQDAMPCEVAEHSSIVVYFPLF